MDPANIIYSSQTLSLKDLGNFELKHFGNFIGNSQLNPVYAVIINSDAVFLSAVIKKTGFFDSSLKATEFHQDLWKQDVLEIFFASDHCAGYQEFNFSPTGAYWQCQFSDYRQRINASETAIENLEIMIKPSAENYRLDIKIPRAAILPDCSLKSGSRLNCAAILGENPRNYFATARLNAGKVDFHDISCWPRLL